MSGKPASVGASRAGGAGASRVLVYVEPRQLEAGGAAPADLRSQQPPPIRPDHQRGPPRPTPPLYTHTDQRNLNNTVFYKPLHDSDTKLELYSSSECIPHRTELFPISQQYKVPPCLKPEETRNVRVTRGIKQDSVEQAGAEFSSVQVFQGRIPESDPGIYKTKCSGSLAADTMPSMQQIALRHGHNQYSESVTVHSEGSTSDRELSVGKSYVNYQILEQSVSHQSIVNQSISILNQQVGVNQGISSESDRGNTPQLVRTADGVVLAVLPGAPVISQPTDTLECSRTAHSDTPQTITVPLGWRRIISGTSVLYLSPSGTALSTLPQLREYLQTAGTCKCGLPCPLRPETAFSFDSKVASKPYQVAYGAELTKLCNHKRKLLATLQARAHSPATPPPLHMEPKKVAGTEVAVLKKKMKKRPGFPANVSVSQLMVERERPLAEFKPQDNEPTVLNQQRGCNGLPPAYAPTQHMLSLGTQDDTKPEMHVQKSSHYITVNNGWITQQKQDGQKPHHLTAHPNNSNNSSGMPVRGANGQIIGINTAYTIHPNYKNAPNTVSTKPEPEQQQEKKEKPAQPIQQQVKYQREDEPQTFCGLNQALTPEVMQKINEQQQIFIQQNQKQIEMAMKGYRSQHSDNTNQNNPVTQGQYPAQGQLVIQNGAVVKTNPAKTPPWQVKRTDSSNSNPITSPSPKIQKIDNMDYEDPIANLSEDSSSSFSSFSSNEQLIPQGMCSRVPPLPQHYNMMSQQWPAIETHKKKGKGAKGGKKKTSGTETKALNFGIRLAQETKVNPSGDMTNVPSFMDDPSGYLAQQTALLNNTISKQVGMNSTYDGTQFDGSNHSNFGSQHQMDKVRPLPKPGEMPALYRNVPNASPSPNTAPDSSVVSDNAMSQCCKGCNVSSKSNSPDFADNQMRLKYMKHNMYRMELEGNATSSPKHSFDDNPVTSSTFTERNQVHGNCSPIQAGTVSTSNVSETMQPEPSPTLSNSSRNTDTPHSSGSSSSQVPSANSYHTPSPVYSNTYKENFNSNPSTPGSYQAFPYNSPGPPTTHASGTQMMHFISNHNVNTNLMEVDNISMVGVKPAAKTQELMRLEPRRNAENSMPGYCPPPHMGGGPAYSLIQACYVQTFVTTMASGFSVTRDTVTSVLAGKANTVTTSINAAQANFIRPPPPPSVNMATTYAIPNNQPDPFLNSVNLPTSYPLHIAGTTAQNMISKSPMEMVQNVIGSIPSKSETSHTHTASYPHSQTNKRTTPSQILISSTGQIIVPKNQMPPPPPKMMSTVASGHCSTSVSNANASGQIAPSSGGAQSIVNQPTVVVNTLQAPYVIQPPMMSVDAQVVQPNAVMPQLVPSNVVAGQSTTETTRQVEVKSHQSFMQGVAMLSPETVKKRSKKKKNITNVLQITAPQQNPNNLMVHSSPQHNTSPQFSPRGFQMSPNNNISPTTPMLQALTIVPGKSGTPAHIVMNGQGNSNNFGSQQIITNTSPSQQINLLQPVNLINNASNVMPNFPAFQQFIVPNLGGMMMTADGTTIIQDNSTGMPMQLQLQTVNGQNVLTPVQNSGVFTGANGGVVIRAQNQQGKIIQSQHSPGAQFLSPNSQVMMNSPNFNGQLSPLLANLSPTNVTFNAGQPVRSGSVQAQEFIQTNQMGQTVMVPVSPKQATNNRTNSTFVHQNTTIVQQQTTLVSNSHNAQMSSLNLQGSRARLSIDPNVLIGKQIVQKSRNFIEMPPEGVRGESKDKQDMKIENSEGYAKFMSEFGPLECGHGHDHGHGHVRHSVSTQTLRKCESGCSPPDTTTHSPLGALEPPRAASPRPPRTQRCASTQGNYADTTTKSPEPIDSNSSAMVQCVSSSEQDIAEARENSWPAPRNDFHADNESHNVMSNMPILRQSRPRNPVESSELHYNQNMNIPPLHNPHAMPMASNYYERTQTYKRKNDFGDGSTYRSDKIMRTSNYNMVHAPKDNEYDMGMPSDKARHYPSGSGSETSGLPRFDRHNLGSSDDANGGAESDQRAETSAGSETTSTPTPTPTRQLDVGDLVWGPVKGYASWPGSLVARAPDGRWSVRWFGAGASGPVHHAQLLTLSEGLEAHHAARTKHRKSRKLNTLLENAIQEAMAELDKKSERAEPAPEGTGASALDVAPITETPKRTKKIDKVKGKDKMPKKTPVKIAPNPHKTGDGARLRSSR